jgi:hypothetical protein
VDCRLPPTIPKSNKMIIKGTSDLIISLISF